MGDKLTTMSFLPLPVSTPIRHLPEHERWRVQIATGLWVENAPPQRLILHGEHVVASYEIGSVVKERLILLKVVQLGWMSAVDLAARWGLHRNTLGNWQWRYRYFGLDPHDQSWAPRWMKIGVGQRRQDTAGEERSTRLGAASPRFRLIPTV